MSTQSTLASELRNDWKPTGSAKLEKSISRSNRNVDQIPDVSGNCSSSEATKVRMARMVDICEAESADFGTSASEYQHD